MQGELSGPFCRAFALRSGRGKRAAFWTSRREAGLLHRRALRAERFAGGRRAGAVAVGRGTVGPSGEAFSGLPRFLLLEGWHSTLANAFLGVLQLFFHIKPNEMEGNFEDVTFYTQLTTALREHRGVRQVSQSKKVSRTVWAAMHVSKMGLGAQDLKTRFGSWGSDSAGSSPFGGTSRLKSTNKGYNLAVEHSTFCW